MGAPRGTAGTTVCAAAPPRAGSGVEPVESHRPGSAFRVRGRPSTTKRSGGEKIPGFNPARRTADVRRASRRVVVRRPRDASSQSNQSSFRGKKRCRARHPARVESPARFPVSPNARRRRATRGEKKEKNTNTVAGRRVPLRASVGRSRVGVCRGDQSIKSSASSCRKKTHSAWPRNDGFGQCKKIKKKGGVLFVWGESYCLYMGYEFLFFTQILVFSGCSLRIECPKCVQSVSSFPSPRFLKHPSTWEISIYVGWGVNEYIF